MCKRSVRKVRHYAPAPSVSERAKNNRSVETGGLGINMMEIWRNNVPRYQKEKEPFIAAQEESNEREEVHTD